MKIVFALVSLGVILFGFDVQPRAGQDQARRARPRQDAGSRIAFTRIREDVDRPGDFRLEAEIWMMNSDGSGAVRLTRNTTDDLGAVWSPDGQTVAFYGVQFTPDASGRLVGAPPQIFLLDVDTRVQRPLLTERGDTIRGRFPSWSPDGRRIAFDTGGPNSGLSIVNVDGSGLRQLLPAPAAGRHIRPDWSPDGRKIAFASGAPDNEQIWVMNADGSGPVRLTAPESGGRSNGPDWSPDGRSIVFQSDRDSAEPRRGQIYVMEADGSNQRRLTNHRGSDGDPEWSPDGRMIAFDRRGEHGVDQVYVVSAEGGQPAPLTAPPSANGHPAWDRSRQKR